MLQVDDIRYLVVHCSDTPDEDGLGATDIHAMHLGFGWDGAGYHAIITRDGICHAARPEYWQGAHVKGRNHDSLGVCLIGRHDFTLKQFAALEALLLDWSNRYPKAKVVGHRDIQETHKTCPNFDAGAWWARYNPLAQKRAMVMVATAPIYRVPPPENQPAPAPETEALMGEEVALTAARQHHGYVEIALATDGYQGWIKADSLCAIPENITGTMQAIRTACCIVTAEADVKSAPLASLSMGAKITILSTEGDYAKISLFGRAGAIETGYLPHHMLASRQQNPRSDWPAYAEMFIGAPYKWGGRSFAGLDCSALIQLSLGSAGYRIPRDSGPQEEFMQTAAKADTHAFQYFKRGDIIFWKGHVGLCVDDQNILHANAYHARVVIEPVKDAITRIGTTDGKPIRHIDADQLLTLLDNPASI